MQFTVEYISSCNLAIIGGSGVFNLCISIKDMHLNKRVMHNINHKRAESV